MLDLNFPRDEKELCDLFEGLLFFEGDAFDFDNPLKNEFKLSEDAKLKLHGLGIINLIFRQWWQTTWGYENWTSFFDGETPRQEFAKLNTGNSIKPFVSVELVRKSGKWKVVPRVFEEGNKNIYFIAKDEANKTKKLLVPPVYDNDLRNFIKWIGELIEIDSRINKRKIKQNSFEDIFRLFWEQAGANIVMNSNLEISKRKELLLSKNVQDKITEYFLSYKYGNEKYLITDDLFKKLWSLFMDVDKKLHSFDKMTEISDNAVAHDLKISYSERVFHDSTLIFDKVVIFPMEVYFNGLESVWINRDNFQYKLFSTIQFLNGQMKFPTSFLSNGKQMISDRQLMEELWFAPCSFFRPTGKVYDFFKSL